jgi:tetratricopeptide (TPR) repeat protein
MYERKQLPLESAAKLLDEAIAIDPGYAPAYAQRGIVVQLLSDGQYGSIPDAQVYSLAKPYIDQALQLDPELGEAWAAAGLMEQKLPGGFLKSISMLEKALALNPGSVDAANWLNSAYRETTQPAKSLALLENIVQRDPLYRPGFYNLLGLYSFMGEPEKADALLERIRPYIPNDTAMLSMEAFLKSWYGDFSAALPLAEEAVRQQPNDRASRFELGAALLDTYQTERAAEEGYGFIQIEALARLNRFEEASLLAESLATNGRNRQAYFKLLNQNNQSAKLLEYFDQRWPDLGAFETDYPAMGAFGSGEMVQIALAYRRVGNEARFREAMSRIRVVHDSIANQGVSNKVFFQNEAAYFAMAQDQQQALKFLALAVDNGFMFTLRITDDMPFFADFEGDPEFQAIQTRMIEHINRERSELGLEPVSA